MRTRRLCGLTLVVLAAHAIGWQIAAGGVQTLAPARAGVRRVALVSVPTRAPAPPMPAEVGVDTAANATPARQRVAPVPRAPAGGGGRLRHAPADAQPWPVYATRAPPSMSLRYALVQTSAAASSAGSARLDWQHDGGAFTLRLATEVDGRPPREWQSTGAFDAAGVAPLRLVEREKGRDRRSVDVDRERGVVRFSGASGTPSVAPGVQDRWSWIAQLAAIVEAGDRHGARAAHWDLQVAGLRGELERWTFRTLPPGDPPPELRPQGNELQGSGDRAPALLHVLRDPSRPYDLRIEAWLSPSLHHLPAGLRMSTPPGPWSLSLWRLDS